MRFLAWGVFAIGEPSNFLCQSAAATDAIELRHAGCPASGKRAPYSGVAFGSTPFSGRRVQATGCRWRLSLASSAPEGRSEEHTSELQSLMRISYAVFCLKKNTTDTHQTDKQYL